MYFCSKIKLVKLNKSNLKNIDFKILLYSDWLMKEL